MIRNYIDLHSVINVLHNGNFRILPFEYVPKEEYYKGLQSGSEEFYSELRWDKRRVKSILLVSTTPDTTFLPGWEVWSDVDGGASIEINPLNIKTGFRIFSLEGGHVAAIRFQERCNVYFKQSVDYFEEFPMNNLTLSLSYYSMEGTPGISGSIDFGLGEPYGIMSVYGGNFENVFRVTDVLRCPGSMTRLDLILSVFGEANESLGISGINLCLGSYNPICPYTDNPVQNAIASSSVILWEEDNNCTGYQEVETGGMLIHTLGDPLSIDFAPPPDVDYLSWPMQFMIGTPYHNAHYIGNPFNDGVDGWDSKDALHGIRVKMGDLTDRGVYTDISNPLSPTIARKASLLRMIEDGIRFGTRTDLGLTHGVYYPPGSVSDLIMNEFMKSVRCSIFLPASPGLSYDSSKNEMSYIDYWEQRHFHYLLPQPEEVLPPYREFKVYMKI